MLGSCKFTLPTSTALISGMEVVQMSDQSSVINEWFLDDGHLFESVQ